MAQTIYFLLPIIGNSTWTVPANWNNSNNKIECIGGGSARLGSRGLGAQGVIFITYTPAAKNSALLMFM